MHAALGRCRRVVVPARLPHPYLEGRQPILSHLGSIVDDDLKDGRVRLRRHLDRQPRIGLGQRVAHTTVDHIIDAVGSNVPVEGGAEGSAESWDGGVG